MVRLVARRLDCTECGLARQSKAPEGIDFEYWFQLTFRQHHVWARNLDHLDLLVRWLSGAIDPKTMDSGAREYVEALPEWMIEANNRPEIAQRLQNIRIA